MSKDLVKTEINVVDNKIGIMRIGDVDYISLTDLAKYQNPEDPSGVIRNWMSNRNSFDYYGLWEQINNENFNSVEFHVIKTEEASYNIPINYNKVINNEITSETKMLKKQKIDNLYEYLETKKNITLIKNDDLDKCWYDIPSDNGDIIQKYFLSIADEENKDLKKNKIINLKKLFPKELMLINKLEKLMLKMEKDNFISFINIIYDKRERMIDYDTIRKTGAKFTKRKSKKVAYINR